MTLALVVLLAAVSDAGCVECETFATTS